MTHRPTVAALTALVALPLIGVGAYAVQDAAAPDLTTSDRAATEQVVRDYLFEHPEVVIEAIERYQVREALAAEVQAEDAVRAYLPRLSAGEAGVALGAPEDEAEVIVVEFFDYHCGYCRRATDFVLGLTEEPGVRVVFQDLPILREESRTAALAGLAAAEHGDYAEMHAQLMRTSGTLDDAAVERAAREAGASKATRRALGAPSDALAAKLDLSIEIAEAIGVQGTPAFLVASPDAGTVRLVPGYAPDAVREAIEAVRG